MTFLAEMNKRDMIFWNIEINRVIIHLTSSAHPARLPTRNHSVGNRGYIDLTEKIT